jgi:hypothetical protein
MKNNHIFPLVHLSNAGTEPVLATDPGSSLGKGQYALANEERFTAAFYSEPLTAYATNWSDSENLDALLDFVAPRVPVGRRFEFKQALNSEAFLSEGDDLRAIGANFKRIEYKGVSVNSKTDNRGLVYRLDLDEEGGGILSEELIVARILQRLKRNQYRRAMTALLAACTLDTAKTWSSGASVPTKDVTDRLVAALTNSGQWPNRLWIDAQAWAYRRSGLEAQLTAGAIASFSQSLADWAATLPVEAAMLSKAVYQSSASAKTIVGNARVIVFQGQTNPSRDDPTNVKRFVTPVGDGDFRVYRQPVGAKFVDISVEYYDGIYGTSTVGAQSLTIS